VSRCAISACASRRLSLEQLDAGHEQKIDDGAAHLLEEAEGWL
jgi:hypothetical protein